MHGGPGVLGFAHRQGDGTVTPQRKVFGRLKWGEDFLEKIC